MEILNEMYKLNNPEVYENCFKFLQNKILVDEHLKKLEKALKSDFNIDCQIKILYDKRYSNYFFGMRVYPSEEELKRIALKIVESKDKTSIKFEKCKNVLIEIDPDLLWNKDINATPREITAVLLHEIGHKIYSNEYIYYYITRLNIKYGVDLGSLTAMIAAKLFVPLIIIGLLAVYNVSSIVFSKMVYINGEKDADSLPTKFGYGEDIFTLLDRINKMYNYSKENEEKLNLIERFNRWVFKKTDNIEIRKRSIIRVLKQDLKEADSEEQAEIIRSQIKILERQYSAA